MEYTRKQYLDNECSHADYYGQFVSDGTITRVLNGIGKAKIMASTDPHFNDIPLSSWDRLVPECPGSGQFKEAGDYYTLAGGVSLLKEAARQIKERG